MAIDEAILRKLRSDDPPQDRMLAALDILLPEIAPNTEYPKDPVIFIRDVLGINLWWMQEEIVRSVWENRYTSVASCHGIGKSYVTAAMVIAWLHCHENSIVLSTAPTGRQVEHVLWRNIRAIHRRAKRPLLGRKPLTTRYDIAEDWYAMGFKPVETETDPTQGFHAEYVLIVIDEAAGTPTPLIDGLHAAMTTEHSRMLMIGNPTSASGPFFDSHHGSSAMYKTFRIAFSDTPNAKAGKVVIKGLITQQWVDETREKYGEESAYFQSRVLAEWVSESGLISLAHIDAAKARDESELPWHDDDVRQAGLDIAREGADKSVLTLRRGSFVTGQWEIPGKNSWETAGGALDIIAREQPDTESIKLDIIGMGVGVYDVMEHLLDDPSTSRGLDLRVIPFNASKRPHDPEKYRHQRDEAYGMLADRFRSGNIAGYIHANCVGDLSDLKTKFDGRHTQPIIESKDDFRKRTGHSSDYGDSIALAFYDPPPEIETAVGVLSFGYADQRWGRL